jgi:hypothetical protein
MSEARIDHAISGDEPLFVPIINITLMKNLQARMPCGSGQFAFE